MLTSPALRYARANSGLTFRPDSSCVLWMPGQDDPQSVTIRDRSGNGNNGTTDATWTRTGRGLWGLDYDGEDDLTTVADAASIQNIFDGGGTIEAWINPRSDGELNIGWIFGKVWYLRVQNESASNMTFLFYQDFDGAANGDWITSTRVVPINTFTYIGISYDSDATTNDPTFVVNDTIYTVGSGLTEQTTPVGTRVTDVGTDLTLGNLAATSVTFDGGQSLYRLSNVALSTAVLQGHYQQERHLFGV